jgi:enamine deaminase RidA (YjgF/YER057c/UK114 family)
VRRAGRRARRWGRADWRLDRWRLVGWPWRRYGYSRVAVGDAAFVAGTTDAGPDGRSTHPGDPAAQARAIFGIIEAALVEAGFSLADVVRTRMYVTGAGHVAEVGTVHGEVFADVRPASTAIVVAALIDPSLLVEIEVRRADRSGRSPFVE